jgi:hypothetical protein
MIFHFCNEKILLIIPITFTKIDPGLMYDPVLGVDIAHGWSVTSVFMTEYFSGKISAFGIDDTLNAQRFDPDPAVNL